MMEWLRQLDRFCQEFSRTLGKLAQTPWDAVDQTRVADLRMKLEAMLAAVKEKEWPQ
jgi:hypothetical protein